MPNRAYNIHLLYGAGGGGHKASALAVQHALENSYSADVLDIQLIDASYIAGASPGDSLYNFFLTYDAVAAIELLHSAAQFFYPFFFPLLRNSFRSHFSKFPNLDCVVSFVPTLNAVFAESLPPHIPLITVLTDFSHTHSHPWIQHPRQHFIAGTDIAVAQALASGYQLPNVPSPSMRVTPTSGMVVHPRFYTKLNPTLSRRKRVDLGFPPDLATVLLLFGGTPPTDRVVQLVDAFLARPAPDAVNIIAVCAKNRTLFNRLTRRKHRDKERRLFVTGFTNDVPTFMQVSDILVGKPGPGVVSEALVSGLPCVLFTGANDYSVMKQERDVLDWVRRHRVGIVVKTAEEAADVSVAQMKHLNQRVAEMRANEAVFEARDIILQSISLPPDCDRDSITQKVDANGKFPSMG